MYVFCTNHEIQTPKRLHVFDLHFENHEMLSDNYKLSISTDIEGLNGV